MYMQLILSSLPTVMVFLKEISFSCGSPGEDKNYIAVCGLFIFEPGGSSEAAVLIFML